MFVIKQFPVFFIFKRAGETQLNVKILYSRTYVTDTMSDSLSATMIGSRKRLPWSPLEPAETAPPPAPPCAHKTVTLHTQTMSTTFTNDFCACQLSPFTKFRPLHSLKFRHFWTAAWQQWILDSDSEPDLDVFCPRIWVKMNILRQLWAPAAMWIKWLAGRPWLGCRQGFNFKWQCFCGNVPDSNTLLTSKLRLVYVKLCFYFLSH